MLEREDIIKRVEAELQKYCRQVNKDAVAVGAGYVKLWQEIEAYIMAGGKRIRPYLVMLAYQAYGGKSVDAVIPAACAWEFLHSSLLVHDDIIDRDTIRHGKLNIAGKYEKTYKKFVQVDAEHYALSAALLAGDLLLSATYDIVNSSDLLTEEKTMVIKMLHKAIFSVGGGELIDVESALYDIDSADITKIAHYKTATYSFQLPMICGASLAGAAREDVVSLDKLGLELGIAFQMQDDLLGVFGSEKKTGKSNRSDIREKKRTLLILFTKNQLSNEHAKRLNELYENQHDLDESEVEEVVDMITSTNARAMLQEEIDNRSVKAKQLIDQLNIRHEYKAVLAGLVDKLAVRNA